MKDASMSSVVLAALSAKDALTNDEFFVGRGLAVQGCVGLGKQLKLVWVWGPHRTGKSSLAERLGRDFVRRDPTARVVRIDASDVADFEDLLKVVVHRIDGGIGGADCR